MSRIDLRFAVMAGLAFCLPGAVAQAQWVKFENQTSTRMPVGPGLNTPELSTSDPDEKDYAWGDVDQDGDIDLVVVRKQPFTSPGRRRNVLFMNEGIKEGHAINGVLVDRTELYATDSDAPGWDDPQVPGGFMPDQGFLTPTNDRDVLLVDVNNDTWLDIVTATTISDDAPHHIGHPRIYINKGKVNGVWQGFKFEVNRIPPMLTAAGVANKQPRFCSVAAGDVTNDGYVDLYFGDYDSSGAGGSAEPPANDFNNKFLINEGGSNPGWFIDTMATRISAANLVSAFGAASQMADMNGDGVMDIVKQTSLNAPVHVAIHHNNPNNPGFFPSAGYKIVNSQAPYFVSVGDLNNDGRMDLVITDDAIDHYHLNVGNDSNGWAMFSAHNFQNDVTGFGSQSVIADLNNDGWNDVVIADVDVDIGGPGGCSRFMHVFRNLGNAPNVTLTRSTPGGMTDSGVTGTHNVAIFDIDNDGWLDMVVGRCTGTQVYMNVPPAGLVFTYPQGLPAYITPDETYTFQVQLSAISGGTPVPGSGKIHISEGGGKFVEVAMTSLGGNLYEATLPAGTCPNTVNFYFTGQLTGGGTFFDPPNAPASSYVAVAALGTEVAIQDEMEGDVSAWTVINDPSLTAGAWEVAEPNPTINAGALAAPDADATGGPGINAFVTQNGPAGDTTPGTNDVDGGPTHLISPTIDLDGTDATISFSAWFYTSLINTEFLSVAVSNDNGATWTPVKDISWTNAGTNTTWQVHSFVVGDYVTPTAQVRVRFTANDVGTPSVVEAGIDNFIVERVVCGEPNTCPADVAPKSGDGAVDVVDLLFVINNWGALGGPADVNGDNAVNVSDLLAVINAWGSCP